MHSSAGTAFLSWGIARYLMVGVCRRTAWTPEHHKQSAVRNHSHRWTAHRAGALAQAAEQAGWDGVYTGDGIHISDEIAVYDPWVLLAAFAAATQRVRLGAIIMPLARRRPWKVAREAVHPGSICQMGDWCCRSASGHWMIRRGPCRRVDGAAGTRRAFG